MNRKYFVAFLIVFLVISSCQTKKTRQGNVLSETEDRDFPFIQKVDSDLDDIIAPDTKGDIIS